MIQTADAYIDAQKQQIQIRDLRITEYSKQVLELSKENADLKITRDRWYHNTWALIAIGVAAGVIIERKF